MKVDKLDLGTIYMCKLSGKQMLVIEIEQPADTIQGEKGELIEVNPAKKVKGGKYVDEVNGIPTFKLDEIFDGQLKEITEET
tara:strand:- start:247 stop:492 length:246 start_codon:yes stop_codon:yes gene_type:complete